MSYPARRGGGGTDTRGAGQDQRRRTRQAASARATITAAPTLWVYMLCAPKRNRCRGTAKRGPAIIRVVEPGRAPVPRVGFPLSGHPGVAGQRMSYGAGHEERPKYHDQLLFV